MSKFHQIIPVARSSSDGNVISYILLSPLAAANALIRPVVVRVADECIRRRKG